MHAAFSSQQKAVCVIKSRCFMAVRCPLNQELAYTLNQTNTKQRVSRFRHSTDTRLHGCTFVLKGYYIDPFGSITITCKPVTWHYGPPPPPPPPPKLNKEYGPPDREFQDQLSGLNVFSRGPYSLVLLSDLVRNVHIINYEIAVFKHRTVMKYRTACSSPSLLIVLILFRNCAMVCHFCSFFLSVICLQVWGTSK